MSSKNSNLSKIVFSLILSIFFYMFSVCIFQYYYESKNTQKWLHQEVIVLSSVVIERKCGKGQGSVCHCAKINIGFNYLGRNIKSNLETQDNCLDANSQIEKYPLYKKVTILVNPEDYSETRSLDFPLRAPPYIFIITDLLILCFIALILKYG